ncbi:hypothetical protein G5714_006204 [Onychostoma macrolepis]|uniref:Uncharacterized protein n=1 Tax=Onychostoma macrolepis TaxID=369639 RepID=A0A7J6D369_9TELE|nr:hypothetical protein G5714_006204 [Onychostoma macrolepis]
MLVTQEGSADPYYLRKFSQIRIVMVVTQVGSADPHLPQKVFTDQNSDGSDPGVSKLDSLYLLLWKLDCQFIVIRDLDCGIIVLDLGLEKDKGDWIVLSLELFVLYSTITPQNIFENILVDCPVWNSGLRLCLSRGRPGFNSQAGHLIHLKGPPKPCQLY